MSKKFSKNNINILRKSEYTLKITNVRFYTCFVLYNLRRIFIFFVCAKSRYAPLTSGGPKVETERVMAPPAYRGIDIEHKWDERNSREFLIHSYIVYVCCYLMGLVLVFITILANFRNIYLQSLSFFHLAAWWGVSKLSVQKLNGDLSFHRFKTYKFSVWYPLPMFPCHYIGISKMTIYFANPLAKNGIREFF